VTARSAVIANDGEYTGDDRGEDGTAGNKAASVSGFAGMCMWRGVATKVKTQS
jgi:hypothetical protein